MAYPTLNTDKTIILHGAPVFWALGVYFDETQVKVSASDAASAISGDDFRLLFDNIKSGSAKITVKGTTSASGENIDIEAADGAITRFPKTTRIIDGRTDTEIMTDATNDENATGKGEVTVETNQGDLDSDSWTEFLNYVVLHKDDFWLLCLPTGFNYNKRYVADSKTADGYLYMLSKISSDFELKMENAPSSLSLTFISYKFASSSESYASSMATNAFATALTGLKLKGTNPAITVTPTTLSEAQSALIAVGEPVLAPSA